MLKVLSVIHSIMKLNFTPYVLFGGVALLGGWIFLAPTPAPTIIHEPGGTTVVQLPGATLPAKEVIKYVQDATEVKKLLAENSTLKTKVAQLTESLGASTSSGGGNVVTTTIPSTTTSTTTTPEVGPITKVSYKDYRLDFVADTVKNVASYTLTQKFEVLTTSGVAADGHPTATVKLFEIGPNEARTNIPVVTTVVVANPNAIHWNKSFTIQGGLVVNSDGSHDFIGGVQWLTRETSRALRDQSYALLTPALNTKMVGLLPISYNLGSLKKNPLSNLWLSPMVGVKFNAVNKIIFGGVVTASF